jgi:hypothetical protein
MVAPPEDEIVTLVDLAIRGNIRGIVEQATGIEALAK